jgi:hypothetical protein
MTKKHIHNETMKTKYIVSCLTAVLALPVLEVFAETPIDFSVELTRIFDFPADGVSTEPQKICDSGNPADDPEAQNHPPDVVGIYVDPSLVQRGFYRAGTGSGGFYTSLVDPNDTGNVTQCRGINRPKVVCGDYLDGNTGDYHGFFIFNHGPAFHDYDVPGATSTFALGVNNAGDFCGSDIPASGIQSGFVSIGGVVTEFTVPDATTTIAYQINDGNQAAGYYLDASSVAHGFYRESDGSIVSPIDPTGSTGTIVFGNNNKSRFVGRYSDTSGLTHGFVFIPPSTYIIYDYPGSTFTSLNGINNGGSIVGRYLDANGVEHGIFARLVRGTTDHLITGTIPQRQLAQVRAVKQLPARSQLVVPPL